MPQRKLLLADDSITIQKVVNLTFADEGFDVITAKNGDEALRQISEQRPDIVLADVNIPGPNGYEICEMIRRIEEIKDLPVVLLVGSYEPFDPDRAQHVGANDFLTKPFSSIRQLVATVSNLMPEQPVAMPSEQLPEPEELPSPNADTLPMEHPNTEQGHTAAEAGEKPPSTETETATSDLGAEPTAKTADYSPAFTDDIENLYDQSLASTIEIPHAAIPQAIGETDQAEPAAESAYQPPSETREEPSFELGDPSMDDEMIETVYVEEPETPEQDEFEQPNSTPETDQHTQQEADQSPALEAEVPAEGPADSYVEPPAELSEGEEQDFLRNLAEQQPASYLSNEPENETFFEAEPEQESEPEPEPESAGDEAMAFRSEEPVPSETNGNGAHPHEAEEESSEGAQFAEAAPVEHSMPWDSVARPQPFNPPPADTVPTEEFEESDLLGLVETGEPTPPTTWQEASIQDVGSPQFSDEMIDRIADRVVAKLSEQLVREIVDRIVPDAVESFILKKFGRSDDR